MVRAGVVARPDEWIGGARDELSGRRRRYRIIDQCRLLDCLECQTADHFREWYGNTIESVSEGVGEAPGSYVLRTSRRRRESLLSTVL